VTHDDYEVACAASVEVSEFETHLAELTGLIAPRFSRHDLRSNATARARWYHYRRRYALIA
jgi:hypothetical protein